MSRRCLQTIALASICVANAYAQDLSKHLAFECSATSASKAVASLSKSAGFPFEVSPVLANETILIHVGDATLGDLTTRIAEAMHASWRKLDSKWRLERSSSQIRELKAAELNQVSERYATEVRKQGERAKSQPRYTKQEAAKTTESIRKAMLGGPIGGPIPAPSLESAISSVLSTVDPKVFASIPPRGRLVLSTNPTRAQSSLSHQTVIALRSFTAEMALYQAANAEATKSDTATEGNQRRFMRFNKLGEVKGNATLGIGKVVLVVSRAGSTADLNLQLHIVDPNGDSLGGGSSTLRPAEVSADESGTPINVSPLALTVAKATTTDEARGRTQGRVMSVMMVGDGGSRDMITMGNEESMTRAQGELRKALLHPDEIDPQSFGTQEALIACADDKKANLVAWIPDDAFMPLNAKLARQKLSVSSILAKPEAFELSIRTDSNWLVVSPLRPASAVDGSVNRAALAAICQAMDKKRFVGLADILAFARNQTKAPARKDLDGFYMNQIDGGAASALTGLTPVPYQAFQFLSTLSNTQLDTLFAGSSIRLDQLNSNSLAALSTDVFTSLDGPTHGSRDAMMTVTAGPNGVRFGPDDLANERTEFLLNGMPMIGEITLSRRPQDAVLAIDASGTRARVLSAAELGISQKMSEAQQPEFGSGAKFVTFYQGKISRLDFSLMLPDNVQLHRTFTDCDIDISQPSRTYDQLAEDFRRKAEDIGKGINFNGLPKSRRGRTVPPTP